MFSLFCEYSRLEYVRIHVIYSVNQAEYVIHILVVAPQEYVNIYSTRRLRTLQAGTVTSMLGGWVNPHREQQTIPQGQTSSPPKSFFTPTAKARPDQAALATSAEARGATHRAGPRRSHTHTATSMKRDRRKSV